MFVLFWVVTTLRLVYNFATSNIDSKNTPLLCPGISRIRRKDSDKSYEECLVNFIKTFKPEVTPNPSILLEDT